MPHFPLTLQHDTMQCGIACLQMVCNHYGHYYSLGELEQICHATTEGVSLLGISEAATRLGLHTVCGKVELAALADAPLPAILHWQQNHFVVLYKAKRGKYLVADPGKGLVRYTEKEIADNWFSTQAEGRECGIAMFIEPTPEFYKHQSDAHGQRRSFSFLFGYLKQYRRYFGQIIIGLLLGCVLQLILPFLTQAIVDVGIAQRNVGFVWLILLGQLMLTVSRTTVDFIRRWLLLHIGMRINISLVSDFFIKLLKLPMSFFDTKLMGDLLQRMSDHQRVEKFLTNQTLNVAFSMLSFVVFGIVLLLYNRLIFCIFILFSLLYGGWMAVFLKKRRLLDFDLFEREAENHNKTYQFLTSMQEIKLQDCGQRRRWEWEDVQVDLFGVQMRSLKLQQTQEAGGIFINEVKNIVITVLAATAVINGQLTLGAMLAVQYIMGQLNSPVEQLMDFFYALQDVKISLERINEIHAAPNEDSAERQLSDFKTDKPDLQLKNVSFKYDPHSIGKTIDNVSVSIPHGQVTAIVGASGSGKTTLVKLMLGYYPASDGCIEVDGRNIAEYNLQWWRRQCGAVMQDGVIFSESVARNIAVGDGEIDEQRLVDAAKTANIFDFIMSLPLKFNTIIGRDGMGLSQGQRQRILIARAVYKNPLFLFLDEATNALDAENERAIVENLAGFYKGRTTVVVAHRLSTVRNADQIIVLGGGKVLETGTHSELTAKRGAYYNLVKNQLELGN